MHSLRRSHSLRLLGVRPSCRKFYSEQGLCDSMTSTPPSQRMHVTNYTTFENRYGRVFARPIRYAAAWKWTLLLRANVIPYGRRAFFVAITICMSSCTRCHAGRDSPASSHRPCRNPFAPARTAMALSTKQVLFVQPFCCSGGGGGNRNRVQSRATDLQRMS